MITAGPIFLAGADASLLWNLANLMQVFYYLLFYNIEYPQNLVEFLKIFSLGRLEFFQEPFSNWVPIDEVPQLPSSPKFYDNGVSGFFLQSASAFLQLWCMTMLVYIPVKVAQLIRKKLNLRTIKIDRENSGEL